jgi:hypothetical protein
VATAVRPAVTVAGPTCAARLGAPHAQVIWYAGLVIAGSAVVWRTVRGALRGYFAADVVATLAIVASVLAAQPLVGLVIVIMQTGGEALGAICRRTRVGCRARAGGAAAPWHQKHPLCVRGVSTTCRQTT